MSPDRRTKSDVISVRVKNEKKRELTDKAREKGQTLSEFLVDTVVGHAKATIEEVGAIGIYTKIADDTEKERMRYLHSARETLRLTPDAEDRPPRGTYRFGDEVYPHPKSEVMSIRLGKEATAALEDIKEELGVESATVLEALAVSYAETVVASKGPHTIYEKLRRDTDKERRTYLADIQETLGLTDEEIAEAQERGVLTFSSEPTDTPRTEPQSSPSTALINFVTSDAYVDAHEKEHTHDAPDDSRDDR